MFLVRNLPIQLLIQKLRRTVGNLLSLRQLGWVSFEFSLIIFKLLQSLPPPLCSWSLTVHLNAQFSNQL